MGSKVNSARSETKEKKENVERSIRNLAIFRLCFYTAAMVHIAWLAFTLLPLDFTKSEHENVRRMQLMRHTLLTAWTNYLQVFYFPICLYVEWKELNGEELTANLERIRTFRHFFFTALVLPSTVYAGSFFWRVWNTDRELLVPSVFDEIIPIWMQHNLHTISVIVCLVDLCIVPRLKPQDTSRHTFVLKLFLGIYLAVGLLVHDITGFWPYPFISLLSPWKLAVFVATVYMENLFLFHMQWFVSDMVWGPSSEHTLDTAKHAHVPHQQTNSIKFIPRGF